MLRQQLNDLITVEMGVDEAARMVRYQAARFCVLIAPEAGARRSECLVVLCETVPNQSTPDSVGWVGGDLPKICPMDAESGQKLQTWLTQVRETYNQRAARIASRIGHLRQYKIQYDRAFAEKVLRLVGDMQHVISHHDGHLLSDKEITFILDHIWNPRAAIETYHQAFR